MESTTSAGIINAKAGYRLLENGHVLLWLIKDACWAMVWRPGGMFMILPTLGMAIYIAWRSKRVRSELLHNIAVCLWIAANSVWMTGEFFNKELRPVAVALFIAGLALLVFYYVFLFPADYRRLKANNAHASAGDSIV